MKTLDNKQQSALQKAAKQKFGKAADVPKGFTESVMRQVMAESAPVSRKRSLHLLPWLSAAAAVFIIIMLAVNNQQPKEETIISQKKSPITKTLITKSDYPKEQESKSDLTINEKRSVANKSQKSTINSQQSIVNSQHSIVNSQQSIVNSQ
ncbi:MAG: hypothetical protein HUK07_08460 [Bacteroidaceae bacterium]|nr:hypothetical protein [Bacteroidaceae bacterium]